MKLLFQEITLSIFFHALAVASFQPKLPTTTMASCRDPSVLLRSTTISEGASSSPPTYLYTPVERDAHYKGNTAQYLVDLHNEKATLNFCGGMMFQFVLSEKLRAHLQEVATTTKTTTSMDEEQL